MFYGVAFNGYTNLLEFMIEADSNPGDSGFF
jgi:hypothetical protein